MSYLGSRGIVLSIMRGYREADLRLCFRICKKLVFSRRGSFHVANKDDWIDAKADLNIRGKEKPKTLVLARSGSFVVVNVQNSVTNRVLTS